jgi:hypothetical protein
VSEDTRLFDLQKVVSGMASPDFPDGVEASRARLEARFAKKGEFVTRSIAGSTILVPVRGQIGDLDAIYNFNEVGAFIWKNLDGIANVRQIIEAVAGEFDVSVGTAEVDTLQFVSELEAAGVIEPAGQGSQS